MEPNESYEERTKMAEMHDDVLHRIENDIETKQSIEACWLCYACFECRINRTLEKLSEKCARRKCFENYRVGIQTRIDCIKRLQNLEYANAEVFDLELLDNIKAWCKERNKLVHSLIDLDTYAEMDKKFLDLAKRGLPIVSQLYSQTTDFRNQYYLINEMPPFPARAMDTCSLLKDKKKN